MSMVALQAVAQQSPRPGGIDTHIHLYEPVGLDWLKPTDTQLNQPHHADHFIALAQNTPINRAVVVEAGTTLEHNQWMLDHARNEPAVAAVIGNLDLNAPDTGATLRRFMKEPKFRGLRLRARGPVDFSSSTVRKNLTLLQKNKLVLETGLDAHTRNHIVQIAQDFPQLTIIINHMGDGRLDKNNQPQDWWPPLMKQLGACTNVYCKLSMFDFVFKHDYAPERLDALFNPILSAFGTDRLLYGSNWPVSPDYDAMLTLFSRQLDKAPEELKNHILIENPTRAYRIQPNDKNNEHAHEH